MSLWSKIIVTQRFELADLMYSEISHSVPHLPIVEMDVKRNKKVDFRKFLRHSLRKVCTREGPDILERCLHAVLPVCNDAQTRAFLED